MSFTVICGYMFALVELYTVTKAMFSFCDFTHKVARYIDLVR